MLSMPSSQSSANPADPTSTGILNYLSPKRSQQLVAREAAVTLREAEVARREAELLAGAPGGIVPSPSPILCPPCAQATTVETIVAPVQTVIKEVVREDALTPPGWTSPRIDEILDRELKVAERERDISRREESLNRREHDASRRESWIMEQLIALGNDEPAVEEEYVYEPSGRRKAKYQELPPLIVSETQYETETMIVTQIQTVTVPPPANTRFAASPAPQRAESSTGSAPRTTAVEVITEEVEIEEEEEEDDEPTTVRVVRPRPTRKVPGRWFGGW